MRLIRHLALAAAVAVTCIGTVRADGWMAFGNANDLATPVEVSAATRSLFENGVSDADTVEVFHGRWRPYWRGYYHGSSGFAPRPNFWYGPVIYPRFYTLRPAYSPVIVAMPLCPSPVSVVMTSASPVSPTPSQSNPLPKTPPVSSESFYRYDGGPNSPIPRAGSFRPAETAEPPLAVDTTRHRRVNSASAAQPTPYAAYGETPGDAKPKTMLVRNR